MSCSSSSHIGWREVRVALHQPRRPRALAHCIALLLRWAERSRQRRDLLEMEEHRLDDIGVTRQAANEEARKPFWRA